MNRILIVVLTFVVWTGLAVGAGWLWRGDRAEAATAKRDTADATAVTEAVQDARATEHTQAGKLADIGETHEKDRNAAEAVPDAVVADLHAGNLRLRQQWQACDADRVSGAAAAATQRHAAAVSREADFGNLVRVGRDADDQLRACQAVVLADREASTAPP